ncbi:MAG: hypothetical protein WBN57_08220 [Gammaproteobacteria bacterium]
MNDRRIIADRRIAGLAAAELDDLHNRRQRPDRRLNSICAEWIPLEDIKLHPATRLVFSRR